MQENTGYPDLRVKDFTLQNDFREINKRRFLSNSINFLRQIIFRQRIKAAVLSCSVAERVAGSDLKEQFASSSRHASCGHAPITHDTPPHSCEWLSTAPPPVSLCCPPGLWRPTWLSSCLVRDPDPDPVPDRDPGPRRWARLWLRRGRGRPPQCWRWTAGSGPGSSGKLPGPGSSAPRAGPARTACACVGTRSPSWCRSWGWWRRPPCSRWRNPRPCWWEGDTETWWRWED